MGDRDSTPLWPCGPLLVSCGTVEVGELDFQMLPA